jgi:hypothetical protein
MHSPVFPGKDLNFTLNWYEKVLDRPAASDSFRLAVSSLDEQIAYLDKFDIKYHTKNVKQKG